MSGYIAAYRNGRFAQAPRLARMIGLALASSAMLVASTSAQAQDQNTQRRLDKVESEVRALQRKVFPGGDGTFFPQITPPAAAPAPSPLPSSTPLTDLLGRMDTLERQVAHLTSQVEQNSNRLGILEARMNALPSPGAASGNGPAGGAAVGTGPRQDMSGAPVGAASNLPANTPAGSSPVRAGNAAAPDSARIAAVKAIVKPQTDDAGMDDYSYGFRLWDAKFYPEAEQQLKMYLEKYPKHSMVSYGRNLLGRAYLDDGNPTEAAKWFLQNYQADKSGARAPDSLLYLAMSMKQLKDTRRACIALAEFSRDYASEAAGRLKSTYDDTRRGLTCN